MISIISAVVAVAIVDNVLTAALFVIVEVAIAIIAAVDTSPLLAAPEKRG